MRRRWLALAVALSLCGGMCLGAAAPQQEKRKMRVGILPVQDLSGQVNETFTQHLTAMVFEELRGTAVEPVLVNPGDTYTTEASDLIEEMGQRAEVDALLIASIPLGESQKNQFMLRVETRLYLTESGKEKGAMLPGTKMQSSDDAQAALKASRQIGMTAMQNTTIAQDDLRRGLAATGYLALLYGSERPFEKQPLGKAARRLAQAVRERVLLDTAGMTPAGAMDGVPKNAGSCAVRFRVAYEYRKATSMSYTLAVNGREESLGLKDGVILLQLASGPVVVQVSLQDAPYKLPTQKVYLANTMLDCTRPERTLMLEIGSIGEGFLRWK